MDKLKKDLEAARREKSMALRRVNSLEVECQDLQAALEEADAGNNEVDENDLVDVGDDLAIRDGGRGRPVAEHFVQHVRCQDLQAALEEVDAGNNEGGRSGTEGGCEL